MDDRSEVDDEAGLTRAIERFMDPACLQSSESILTIGRNAASFA